MLIFSLLSLTAMAQVEQEIISIGERELTVGEAQKIAELPSTIDTTTNAYQMSYDIIPRQVEVNYEVKPIKAAKLNVKEPLTKLYRGYVKAGVGAYTTPLLMVRYNSLRSRDWAYGVKLDHLSSNGGLKGLGNSAYSDNLADVWARKYLKKHTLEVGLNYERNVNHYYGYVPDEDIEEKDFEQRYSTVGFRAALQSYHRDSSKINHRVWTSYQKMNTLLTSSEGNFKIGTSLSKWEGIYKFGLDAEFDRNSMSCGLNYIDEDVLAVIDYIGPEDVNNTIIDISPSIKTQTGDLTATVGLGIVTDGTDGTRFRFYPRAYVSYSLFDDLFTPYAGLTGDLTRNSLHSLSRENPFILPCPQLTNTSKNYDLYAGIRGTIIDNLSFNAKVSVAAYDDFAYFINDTIYSDENAFEMRYDDLNALSINGELSYKHSDALTFTGALTLTTFTPDDFEKAFNLPTVEFSTTAIYDLNNQFVVKATIYAAGDRYGATSRPNGVDDGVNGLYKQKLRSYVDSNLSFEYRYTKKISAFLELNNITGGKYPRWYNYPVQPFLVMGGLTYSF